MNISIREYQSTDKEILLNIIKDLHDFVVELDPIDRLKHMPGYGEYSLKQTLDSVNNQDGKIFLAMVDKQIAGLVIGIVGKKQSDDNLLEVIPNNLGIILDLYVDENFRGNNIGTTLMHKAEEYLKSKGCDGLWVKVFAPNSKAHDFYQKFGFMDREIDMFKKI